MEISEIISIPGAKILNPVDESNVPFKVAERHRVSEERYHELPDNETKGDKVFGRGVLTRYEKMAMAEENFGGYIPAPIKERFLEGISKEIPKSKKELSEMISESKKPKNKGYEMGVSAFFTSAFNNDEIREQFKKTYNDSNTAARRLWEAIMGTDAPAMEINSPKDMAKAFTRCASDLTDDLYHSMLLEYKKQFSEKRQGMRDQLLVYYDTDLRQAMGDFASKHGLDVDDMMMRMGHLKNRLEISFDDSQVLGFADSLGYTENKGQVTLNPFWNMERIVKPSFAHEVTHNLGGASYRVRQETPEQAREMVSDEAADFDMEDEWDLGISAVVPEKSGVSLYSRLRWFDEALTDSVSKELCPSNQKVGGYPNEISLVHQLMVGGKKEITIETFYKAYFEGHNPNLPEDQQFQDTKTLFREISDAYSPGFLVRLDSVIDSWGGFSPYVIAAINEHFPKIASILMRNESINKILPEVNDVIGNTQAK